MSQRKEVWVVVCRDHESHDRADEVALSVHTTQRKAVRSVIEEAQDVWREEQRSLAPGRQMGVALPMGYDAAIAFLGYDGISQSIDIRAVTVS